jgi:hypothetical protein
MIARESFDRLYHQLSTAWEYHQGLRRSQSDPAMLAESALRLDRARAAMRNWHQYHSMRNS